MKKNEKNHMRKKFLLSFCLFLCITFLPFYAGEAQENESDVSMRALLIGCDYFLSQPSTYPAADSNVHMLSKALQNDRRGYESVLSYSGSIASVEALEEAIEKAYQGADENDISLFYISTHGKYTDGRRLEDAVLLLSDGVTEEKLKASVLKSMLDRVKGIKVLILDACNSGAFIGKGLEIPRQGPAPFMEENYYVLCSAGGSEESWYWKSENDGDPNIQYGASYFASVLASVFSPRSSADVNMDGKVTMRETYIHLLENYAASTPQIYPQVADFALFEYDQSAQANEKMISGLVFDDYVILPGQKNVNFSFTLHQEARVYYQLIYQQNGAWNFDNAQMISDSMVSGDTSPGRKMRTLTLETEKMDTAGYVMMLILTKEQNKTVVQASRLLCVQPAKGEILLKVSTGAKFTPSQGEELNIVVRHNLPCSLFVTVKDQEGNTVQRVASGVPSRPQSFSGSTFCWNGYTKEGKPAAPGYYQVEVSTSTGGEKKTAVSKPILLSAGTVLE